MGRRQVGWDPPSFLLIGGTKMPILPSWGGQPGRMGICIISQYLILCKNIFQLIWFFVIWSLSEMKTHFLQCLGKIQYKYLLQNTEKLRPILNLIRN